MQKSKKAIIIGAGPAGLTAAYELLERTDIVPIIIEKSGEIGGISRTVKYKGNRMDIGGHRFFSKSDRVMNWWLDIMPIDTGEGEELTLKYQNRSANVNISDNRTDTKQDLAMLVRKRLSRIYFMRKFFTYPIQLSIDTIRKLGLVRMVGIMASYCMARLFPRKPESTLEDFFINRFGKRLYLLFFKDYTEKVWGVSCSDIPAEWGAQRVKGISIGKALTHAARSFRAKKAGNGDIGQKNTETSLIERFLYPKYGPGQLWEEVARLIQAKGGQILMGHDVSRVLINPDAGHVTAVEAVKQGTGEIALLEGEYFFSTMPIKELIADMGNTAPKNVQEIAAGLQYRDFITVGVLLNKMSVPKGKISQVAGKILPDTWIYVQERDVKVGRLQIFNNWSPFMVARPDTVWVGMEYFCNTTDEFWQLSDEQIKRHAIEELVKMGLAGVNDVLDSCVVRQEKTYPAYFGAYERFEEIKEFTDTLANLFLVGRNGMHKYNNSDHSMLTAMIAVDNIIAGETTKANIWAVNTEQEYHEEKAGEIPTLRKTAQQYPFLVGYLWDNLRNRAWWMAGLAVCLLQFIIFKIEYPFANYMPDSYSYLEAAYRNADVNMWPVAYSKFLRVFSAFTHSDKLLVAFQYFFMQTASILLVFTLCYIFSARKRAKTILLLFTLFNPVGLYMSNYVSADTLFISFSLLWITTGIWILAKPSIQLFICHGLLLLTCFTIRYNAIYYPIITILLISLTNTNHKTKVFAIAFSGGLIIFSLGYTTSKMHEVTGKYQFSAFGSWQLANNALYMYENIKPEQRGPIVAKYSTLEKMVRAHMDTLNKVHYTPEDSVSQHFYLWSPRAPLIKFLYKQFSKDTSSSYFKKWASEGPLYASYAAYLIKKYPWTYVNAFVLPNAGRYMLPPIEFLGTYNMGRDSVDPIAKIWFNYPSLKVTMKKPNKNDRKSLQWYPVFMSLVTVLFVISVIGLFYLGRYKQLAPGLKKIIFASMCLIIVNAVFSVVASPIVVRYQLLPSSMCFLLSIIIIDLLVIETSTHDQLQP